MTAIPMPWQVIDGNTVLAKHAKSRCIFQSSCEWYFIDFVGKFGDLLVYIILAAAVNEAFK